MIPLNFPKYPLQIKSRENKLLVFDPVRKKYVPLTPEEWVRQNCLHYLITDKEYPAGRTLEERQLRVEGLEKRLDIAVCHPDGSILLLVECKAPAVPIDQGVFDQIARYNWKARADFLMVTNGLVHYYCQMDYTRKRYSFLRDLPDFSEL
ncbi:MAG: type I restriction enzyme HsdR N-terminal domain-containing protein [Robiginitalea sp.]